MARAKEVLMKELLDLEPADRAEVAEAAIRSLKGTGYGQLSPDWEEEIQRRLRAVDDGSAELIPWRRSLQGDRRRASGPPLLQVGPSGSRFSRRAGVGGKWRLLATAR